MLDAKIIKFLTAGAVAGFLSVAGEYIAVELYDIFGLLYLYAGPGIIFSLVMSFMIGGGYAWWRKILYFILTSAIYYGAVVLFLWTVDMLSGNDTVALALASVSGGVSVVFVASFLITRRLNSGTLVASFVLGLLVALIVPVGRGYGEWGPDLPNTWLLFPVWQAAIAACIGSLLKNIKSIDTVSNKNSIL